MSSSWYLGLLSPSLRCLFSCFSLTAISTRRIRASAARSPRAHTGRMRTDWIEMCLSKTLKEMSLSGRWGSADHLSRCWKWCCLTSKTVSLLRCGPDWRHFRISPMRKRTNGGTTTWRGTTRRCRLMAYGLWVWKTVFRSRWSKVFSSAFLACKITEEKLLYVLYKWRYRFNDVYWI